MSLVAVRALLGTETAESRCPNLILAGSGRRRRRSGAIADRIRPLPEPGSVAIPVRCEGLKNQPGGDWGVPGSAREVHPECVWGR